MSNPDDPFGDPGDLDKTVIGPMPGPGRAQPRAPQPVPDDPFSEGSQPPQRVPRPTAPQPPPAQPAAPAATGRRVPRPGGRPATPAARQAAAQPIVSDPGELPATGVNPLVAAAAPLLSLIMSLKNRATHSNIEELHRRVIEEMKAFEGKAVMGGCAPEAVRAGRYALCAAVDDLVLNTPWGNQSIWSSRSMVIVFHKEAWGGERFFELLERLERQPDKHRDVIELMYICLSLGFEGMMRVEARGASLLQQNRDRVYRLIRRLRGEREPELSPSWAGIAARHMPLSSYVPLWVVGVVTLGILVAIYMIFLYAINGRADTLFPAVADLPPQGSIALIRPVLEQPEPPPPPEPTPAQISQMQRLSQFLAPEVREGLVELLEDGQTITVRITGEGMFASGSARLLEAYEPVVERIALALEVEPGNVSITGHTDSVPIRGTTREGFSSNFGLSVGRAESVMAFMAPYLTDPGRLSAEGLGEAEPIADNGTAEGRARNRRIDVILIKTL